jgi:hypothetical protein
VRAQRSTRDPSAGPGRQEQEGQEEQGNQAHLRLGWDWGGIGFDWVVLCGIAWDWVGLGWDWD